MPIINYKCNDCGKDFAKIFVEPNGAPKICPVCSSTTITELGSAFSTDFNAFARLSCESCGTCDSCGTPTDNKCAQT